MGEFLPELGPEGITLAESLPVIAKLAGWLVAIGLIYVGIGFLAFMHWVLSKTVGKIWFVGGSVVSAIDGAMVPLSNALGSAIAGIDAHIGYSWHQLARLGDRFGRNLLHLGESVWIVGALVASLLDYREWQKAWDGLVGKTVATVTGKTAKVTHATHAQTVAAAHAAAEAHRHAHAATIAGTIAPELDIAGLRERTAKIEDSLSRAWNWIREHPLALPATVAAATVAVALGRLGGSWIRCRNWNRIGRSVCGLPASLIEGLLGAAIDALVVADLCELVALMSAAAREFEGPLLEVITVADALVGCHGATKPKALTLNAVPLAVPVAPLALG